MRVSELIKQLEKYKGEHIVFTLHKHHYATSDSEDKTLRFNGIIQSAEEDSEGNYTHEISLYDSTKEPEKPKTTDEHFDKCLRHWSRHG